MKRFLRFSSSILVVFGLTIALWPLGQIAFARWNQRALHQAWQAAAPAAWQNPQQAKVAKQVKTQAVKTRAVKTQAATSTRGVAIEHTPWPPTRIIIPDIGLDAVVVQGMDADSLQRAPGHAPSSALPGQPGNCAIAAHRNVFGSWFLRVDELLPGSRITLKTPYETFDYQVMQSLSVPDNDTGILRPAPGQAAPQLTLLTCTMPITTSRIAVIATLVPPENAS